MDIGSGNWRRSPATRPRRRWVLFAGISASVLGWTAMMRNVTSFVGPAAALNNVVLPVWMMALGLALAATRLQPGNSAASAAGL